MSAGTSGSGASRSLRIGKYEVLQHIATGGMGAVYRARDTELGREVALKIMSPEMAARPGWLERFRREARHAARLRHDNIVTLYEFGEAQGTWFLALELVEGIDLEQYITRKGRIRPSKSRRILIQAIRALDHAHQQGIVHRDIKPANFLLTRRDGHTVVKLTDLGLSRDTREDEFRVTRAGNTVGSVDYMSPEQARNSAAADIRSDIYSLGCTFYHMLAGKPPFAEGSLTERIFKHIEAEPTDVRTINPRVPEEMVRILGRMLAKKPEDRYQTPAELLRDLQALEYQLPPAEFSSRTPLPETDLPADLEPEEPAELLPDPEPEPEPEPPAVAAPLRVRAKRPPRPSATAPSGGELSSILLPRPTEDQTRAAAGQFERAREVIALAHYDYGIQLLLSCCTLDPANLNYRKTLRRTEKQKYRNGPRMSPVAWLGSLITRARLRAALRARSFLKVLEHGERIMARDPWDTRTQLVMAEAADHLGLLSMAVWILEEAREKELSDVTVNRSLARLYEKQGSLSQAISTWRLVRNADPTDGEAARKIKDLAANETIRRWNAEEKAQRSAGQVSEGMK